MHKSASGAERNAAAERKDGGISYGKIVSPALQSEKSKKKNISRNVPGITDNSSPKSARRADNLTEANIIIIPQKNIRENSLPNIFCFICGFILLSLNLIKESEEFIHCRSNLIRINGINLLINRSCCTGCKVSESDNTKIRLIILQELSELRIAENS